MTTIDLPAKLDLPQLNSLLAVSEDILIRQIPAFRRRHGQGSAVEENVVTMLLASLDCLDRAIDLAIVHQPTHAALTAMARRIWTAVESAEAEVLAWREVEIWIAAEGEHATKH